MSFETAVVLDVAIANALLIGILACLLDIRAAVRRR